MKKIMFYLVLLSLMACCKDNNVNCDQPSDSAAIAKTLIIGKWRLERTIFRNRLLHKVIYETRNDFPNYELVFSENGTVKLSRNDSLIGNTTFKFIKEKEIAPTSISERDLFFAAIVQPGEFEGVVPFKICSDSLFFFAQSYSSDVTPDQVWSRQ
jgi:hypothetical protein